MRYISGIHALNLENSTDTPGDWHDCGLRWEKVTYRESDESPFGEWGIEYDICPRVDKENRMHHANDVRACLDLVYEGNFALAQGMREHFIDNEEYTPFIFEQIHKLRGGENWDSIDAFMGREYKLDWVNYKEGQ